MAKRLNGEGSVYKRKDGRWSGAYIDSEGRRKYVYGKNQREVRKKLEIEIKKKDLNERQMTVGDWVGKYLREYKQAALKETTFNTYYMNYCKHIVPNSIADCLLHELTIENLQSFYSSMMEKGYNAKTVHQVATIMNGALEQGVKNGMIMSNPNNGVVLPKKQKYIPDIISEEEIRILVEEAKDEWLWPIIVFAAFTGCRKGEIMGLKWTDVDFPGERIIVRHSLCRIDGENIDSKGVSHASYKLLNPKNESSIRSIPLLSIAMQALIVQKKRQEEILKDRMDEKIEFVFTDENGQLFSQRRFLDSYYKVLKKYGIRRYRFHDLRHFFASYLLKEKVPGKVIQELLGHSQISTTMMIYAHLAENIKKEVLKEIDRKWQ